MNSVIEEGQYFGKDYYNFKSTSKKPRHRWFYFKEGFSSKFVEHTIIEKQKLSSDKLNILDPFGGCGTSALTSSLLGFKSTIIEVNPFLVFTTKVKTNVGLWNEKLFNNTITHIVESSKNGTYSRLEDFSTFTQNGKNKKWLFNKSVLRRFTSVINIADELDYPFKNSIKLAAMVAALKCCNAKRDGKTLRYRKNWKELFYSDKDFIREFKLQTELMLFDLNNFPIQENNKPNIIFGDSRKEISLLKPKSFDIIITSPPYLNSFDYSDIYRPELFLGNYISNNQELSNLRLKTLRSHVQANWSKEFSINNELLSPIVKKLEKAENLWNKKIPLMVKAYFDDINKILFESKKLLKENGEIRMIVGTSAYGGIHIPVDLIIADIAKNLGYKSQEIHKLRNLRSSGQQLLQFGKPKSPLRESLLIIK